jgi:lipoprotein-anchoring transpeptidase ErfK/SrfK
MIIVLLGVLAAPFGVLAWAAEDGTGRVPEGTRIGGVDVGGLDRDTAIARLRAQIAAPLDRAVKVAVDGDTRRIGPKRAHLSLNIEQAVDDAVDFGARGNFILRGWRELTGAEVASNERVRVSVDRDAVAAFVAGIAEDVGQPAEDASLSITLESVGVTPGSPGRKLADPDGLTDEIVRALRTPDDPGELTARTASVAPSVTEDSIWRAHPTVVTVSRDSTTVRVFDHGELSKTYNVAVGDPTYPTPTGTFTVQTKQVDPPWNVPDSEWAGDLAGTTIPGGDPGNPLVARWIGFNGSVGFHGTADIGSLGSAASHGCVRMDPADVIDLYDRVDVGTTVYVA